MTPTRSGFVPGFYPHNRTVNPAADRLKVAIVCEVCGGHDFDVPFPYDRARRKYVCRPCRKPASS